MSRGQAHTLEGIAAALIVVTSVVLAVQMTAVTPLTASTANQHVRVEERAAARGVLDTLNTTDFRRAARYWNASAAGGCGAFPGAGSSRYYNGTGPTGNITLLGRLNETFTHRGMAYDVTLVYDGGTGRQRLLYNGRPTENAVTVRRSVTLYDDDHLWTRRGAGQTLANATNYFVPDAAGPLYGVVTVEVVVWRT